MTAILPVYYYRYGHLDHLGIKNIRSDDKIWSMVKHGVLYLDEHIREDYEEILKYGIPDDDNLGYEQIQYLYARSYFKDIPIHARNQKLSITLRVRRNATGSIRGAICRE